MIHTYGPFHLSTQGVIGIAVVAVLILIAAMAAFRLGHTSAGLAFSFASGISLLIAMVTVWAILQHTPVGVTTVFWAMLGSITAPIIWVVMLLVSAFPNLSPKRKVASESRS